MNYMHDSSLITAYWRSNISNSITMIQSEIVTNIQYAKMINYLKRVSELLCVDNEFFL